MMRRGIVRRAAALAVMATMGGTVHACGFHGQSPDLAVAHPRSLDVAFALADAYRDGRLVPLPALAGPLGYMRATRHLRDFGVALESAGPKRAGASVAVLLVESGLWTRYRFGDQGAWLVDPHVAGPGAGEAVIVTAEPVLAALGERRITLDEARSRGLFVEVDPSPVHS